MVTFLTEEDFNKVPVGQFAPAYFDEKNLTTDWLEEELADDGRVCLSERFDNEFVCYISCFPCIVNWYTNRLTITPFKGSFAPIKKKLRHILTTDFSDSDYNVYCFHMDGTVRVYFYFKNQE